MGFHRQILALGHTCTGSCICSPIEDVSGYRKIVQNSKCPVVGHTDTVFSVTFSPDGQRVMSCSGDKLVKIWDAATGAEVRSFAGCVGGVMMVIGEPGGFECVRSGSWTNERVRWQLRMLTGHSQAVYSVDFSPDGKWIVSGSADKLVKIWDAEPGAEVRSSVGVR